MFSFTTSNLQLGGAHVKPPEIGTATTTLDLTFLWAPNVQPWSIGSSGRRKSRRSHGRCPGNMGQYGAQLWWKFVSSRIKNLGIPLVGMSTDQHRAFYSFQFQLNGKTRQPKCHSLSWDGLIQTIKMAQRMGHWWKRISYFKTNPFEVCSNKNWYVITKKMTENDHSGRMMIPQAACVVSSQMYTSNSPSMMMMSWTMIIGLGPTRCLRQSRAPWVCQQSWI